MADTKISALGALTAPADNDVVPIVDVSDTTMAATGTDKKITLANLRTMGRSTFSNAAYTVLATDRYVAQTGTMSASRAVTLPAANALPAGSEIVIADESGTVSPANPMVITRGGSDTIEGGATHTVGVAYGWRRLVTDGTSKWKIIGSNIPGSTKDATYTVPNAVLGNGSTSGWGKDNLKAEPFYTPNTITVTGLQYRLTAAGDAATTARFGIYKTEATLLGGGALVSDLGTASIASTGVITLTGLSVVLTPGWYMLGLWHNSTTTPTWVYYLQSPLGGTPWRGHDPSSSALSYLGVTGTFGAMPDPLGTLTRTYGNGVPGSWTFVFLSWT